MKISLDAQPTLIMPLQFIPAVYTRPVVWICPSQRLHSTDHYRPTKNRKLCRQGNPFTVEHVPKLLEQNVKFSIFAVVT